MWKKISVVFEKGDADDKTEFVCACNNCLEVYVLKDANGRLNDTKNLLDHLSPCPGLTSQKQLQLQQCLPQKPQVSKADLNYLKRKEVEYCVEGYHSSIRSVEHPGFANMMQT